MSSELSQSDLANPIGSLPGELLCKILLHAASSTQDGYETAKAWKRRVDLTRVCRTWRNQVLDYSPFWAGVPLHPRCREIDKILRRWGDHPRRAHANIGGDEDRQTHNHHNYMDLDAELFNAERLGEIRLNWEDECADDDYEAYQYTVEPDALETVNRVVTFLQDGSFPVLRSFQVHFSQFFRWQKKAPGLPFHVLQNTTRALQHLILNRCYVEWEDAPSLTGEDRQVGIGNLITLHLLDVQPPPPNTVFNSILSSSPHLSSLHLSSWNLPADFTPPWDWAASHLQDISLAGPRTPCGRILLKILSRDPSSTHITRFCVSLASDDSHRMGPVITDNEISSRWTNWLVHSEIYRLRNMQLRINEAPTGLWITARPCPTTQRANFTPFQLFLQPESSDESWMRNTQLPPHVTSLTVDTRDHTLYPQSQQVWQDFLKRHASITTLQFFHDKSRAQDILEFLDVSYTKKSEENPVDGVEDDITPSIDVVVQLPNLRSLFFTCTHFDQQFPNHDNYTQLNDLAGVLRRRDRAGAAPLALLRFTECHGVSCSTAKDLEQRLEKWGLPPIDCRSDIHSAGCNCETTQGV